jgi:hypothetical protein
MKDMQRLFPGKLFFRHGIVNNYPRNVSDCCCNGGFWPRQENKGILARRNATLPEKTAENGE